MERPPDRVPTRTPDIILSTASETNEKVTSFRSIRVIFVTANYYAICGPHHSSVTKRQKEGPAPQGSRECRAIEADWPAGGPARACLGSYEHPVVSPQFSHLWQVPFRTVSQPQRGHGGASGVELSLIPWTGDGLAMVKFSVIAGGTIETICSSRCCCTAGSATTSLVRVRPM